MWAVILSNTTHVSLNTCINTIHVSSNTCICLIKIRVINKVLRKGKLVVNTRDNINT